MRFHVKVMLANGVVENYYPEIPQDTLNPGYFAFKLDEMSGFAFNRDGSVDWWPADMVKGIQVAPFKGLLLQIEDEQIYCTGSSDNEIITSLQIHIADLEKRLASSRSYLGVKSADLIYGDNNADSDAVGEREEERPLDG